mmetsp:Transcript_122769/g.382216  ORF Transcript_122769/g.382216 Transcript_122769/m.382216 type:complete len:239 (+) Transcript_122769:79-795(+)
MPDSIEGFLAAARTLKEKVEQLEKHMEQEETNMNQLRSQLPVLGRSNLDGVVVKAISGDLSGLEDRLTVGSARLRNQEQAIKTISKVVQSIADTEMGDVALIGEKGDRPHMERPGPSALHVPIPGPKLTRPTQAGVPEEPLDRDMAGAGPAEPGLRTQREGQEGEGPPPGIYPCLQRDGQRPSVGSQNHPRSCVPCRFYSVVERGCKKGLTCDFCHMLHTSRISRRTGGPVPVPVPAD